MLRTVRFNSDIPVGLGHIPTERTASIRPCPGTRTVRIVRPSELVNFLGRTPDSAMTGRPIATSSGTKLQLRISHSKELLSKSMLIFKKNRQLTVAFRILCLKIEEIQIYDLFVFTIHWLGNIIESHEDFLFEESFV